MITDLERLAEDIEYCRDALESIYQRCRDDQVSGEILGIQHLLDNLLNPDPHFDQYRAEMLEGKDDTR